jgi:type I restriction enzyme, S subunit
MLDAARNTGDLLPYVGNKHVQWFRLDLREIPEVPIQKHERARYALAPGDILVCEGGEVGRAARWNGEIAECCFQKALHRLRPKRDYVPVLLLNLLLHYCQSGLLCDFVTQTSIAHLPKEKFEHVPLPSPPLPEQQAIAEALGDADALIGALGALIAKKRDIKQGAMQELLTGQRRLPGFNSSWELKRVAQFGEVVTGGTPSTKSRELWGGQIPWVTPTDITKGQRDVFHSERQLTPEGLISIRALPAESVLVTCIASIGKNALLKTQGACNQQINAIIPTGNNSDFLYYLFENSSQFLQANAGTTATSIISKKAFRELSFSVPNELEQRAIAAVLSDIDAELAALDAKLAMARALKQGMMQVLLMGEVRLV